MTTEQLTTLVVIFALIALTQGASIAFIATLWERVKKLEEEK